MEWHLLIDLLTNDTFWAAIEALATVVAAVGIVFAAGQFRFEAWNKCQEVFTQPEFTEARGRIFAHLKSPAPEWSDDDLTAGRIVCGKMDELCRLARFFGKKKMLKVWGNPIAKSWTLLEWMVVKERRDTGWGEKWAAFEDLGARATNSQPQQIATELTKIRDSLRARITASPTSPEGPPPNAA